MPFASFWRACAISILVLTFCVPGLSIGIDESLLTKNTAPTLTFGIMPGSTLPNNSVTLSGGLYNFLMTLPGKEIWIERSVEYSPYEQIASLTTGDDGTYLYLDTPPGRAEHKVYYRAVYVKDGRRIMETEPIYLYLGTTETVDFFQNSDDDSPRQNTDYRQIRELPGYRFMIDSILAEDEERYLIVAMFTNEVTRGSVSGIVLASPCGDEFEMLAIGRSGSDGVIHFPAIDGCTEEYMLCPVIEDEITSCTEPFAYIGEEKRENTPESQLGERNSETIRNWLSESQFGNLMQNISEPAGEEEILEEPEPETVIAENTDIDVSPTQIGTEPVFLELSQTQEAQRGIPTPVEAHITSMDGTPIVGAGITLFLSSDLAFWYYAAKSVTDENGIAAFHVDSGHFVTLKARATFSGDAMHTTAESNTLVIIS